MARFMLFSQAWWKILRSNILFPGQATASYSESTIPPRFPEMFSHSISSITIGRALYVNSIVSPMGGNHFGLLRLDSRLAMCSKHEGKRRRGREREMNKRGKVQEQYLLK